ncbi:hypothetical protein BU15DRAFT_67223 [Melanogaster broomeanus]|nr:hypothetical protein BU15DRAFT_67223 [Melanogaster broomeanus]
MAITPPQIPRLGDGYPPGTGFCAGLGIRTRTCTHTHKPVRVTHTRAVPYLQASETGLTQDLNKMPYEVEFENGTGFQVDDLAFDGSNWTTYREELIYVVKLEGVVGQFDGTHAPPVAGTEVYQEWSFRHSVATMLVTFTIPNSLLINFYYTKNAQEIFMQLENRFSKSTTPSPTLSTPTRESRQKRDTSNRERRRKVERDRERSGEDQVTDRSIEKRNRRGKRAAERTGKGEAAARRPEHTIPQSMSLEGGERGNGEASDSAGASPSPEAGEEDAPHRIADNDNVSPVKSMARGMGDDTTDPMADGVSLATPASSPNGHEVETSTNVTATAAAKPQTPSIPLKGEWGAQTHTNDTRADQQHSANAHDEGCSTWAEWHASTNDEEPPGVEDPSRRVERRNTDRPPSVPLEGESDGQRLVTTMAKVHVNAAPPNMSATAVHMHVNTPSALAKGNEECRAHDDGTTSSNASHDSRQVAAQIPAEGRQSQCKQPRSAMRWWDQHQRRHSSSSGSGNDCDSSSHSTQRQQQCTAPWSHSANSSSVHGSIQSEGEWRRVVEEHLPEVLAPHPNSPAPHGCKTKQRERVRSTSNAIEVEPGSTNVDDVNSMHTGQYRSANAHSESESARAEQHADMQYRHEGIKCAPEPSTPPTKRPKRPMEDANPPRGRGRLKPQNPRVHQVRSGLSHIKSGPPGPSDIVRCIGNGCEMLGEHHRPSGTKPEG